MAKNRRQHYIARFYLRNFAEPMFSDDLCVYDIRKQRWERRTPDGVGWFPHLCSMLDLEGDRTDEFDQFLKLNVEDPATPALKKLGTGASLNAIERPAVALFIALTFARAPELMKNVSGQHIDALAPAEREQLDSLVKIWCDWTKKPLNQHSYSEFLKPGYFGAIWIWSQDFQRRLLEWEWHIVNTTRDSPFVTSDRPVFGDKVEDMHLVTFPVSSEVAIVIIGGGRKNPALDRANEVSTINLQTIVRASEFVVASRESFSGMELLPKLGKHSE